jgi:hypothetical protein
VDPVVPVASILPVNQPPFPPETLMVVSGSPAPVSVPPMVASIPPVRHFSFPLDLEDAPLNLAPTKVLLGNHSKSTMGYSRHTRDKDAKQRLKNKVLLGERGEVLKFAMKPRQWNEVSLWEAIDEEGDQDCYAPKVKGKRELKNLECSINFEARGGGSSRFRDVG